MARFHLIASVAQPTWNFFFWFEYKVQILEYVQTPVKEENRKVMPEYSFSTSVEG